MPKGKKRKGSDAWKKLLKIHKKGPKRIKINTPRKKDGVDALMIRENVKKILINLKYSNKSVWAIVFKCKCDQLNVRDGIFNMSRNRLKLIAKLLKKGYESFGHNDFMLGCSNEFKLDRIGRCFLSTGTCNSPDIILNIEKTQKEKECLSAIDKHVAMIFAGRH
jgi:hypothetical protein